MSKQVTVAVALLAVAGVVGAMVAVRSFLLAPTPDPAPLRQGEAEGVEHQPGLTSSNLPVGRASQNGPLFERLSPMETGVDVTVRIDKRHAMKRLYVSGFACGGIAVGDVDGDERPDLFVVGTDSPHRLYRQVAPLKFEDVSRVAGIGAGNPWGSAAAMIDIDGDADLDVYVCNYDAPNQLFLNDGKGQFREGANRFALDIDDASLMPYFQDYDLDGDLDLFLLTNRYYREGGFPTTPTAEVVDGKPQLLPEYQKYYQLVEVSPRNFVTNLAPRRDRMFRCERNDAGQRRYVDVSTFAGLREVGHGLSAVWWDYDEDGLPDLYVCNDYDDPDHLYRNNGDGTFDDVIADAVPHTPWFSMGSDAADVDNDGRLDLLVADMSGTTHYKSKTTMGAMNNQRILSVSGPPPQLMRNSLYLHSGVGRFREAAHMAGLSNSDWTWTVKFGDLDNDGRVDLLLTNGMTRSFNDSDVRFSRSMVVGRTEWDVYESRPTRREQNLALKNLGEVEFADVSRQWGLDDVGMSFAAVQSDLDLDGDLDVIVANMDEPLAIYRNRGASGHRVAVALRTSRGDTRGLGARVKITTARGVHLRQVNPFTGFKSSGDYDLHFGLGGCQRIAEMQIQWPDGFVQKFSDLPVDRRYIVMRPLATPPRTALGTVPAGLPKPAAERLYQSADDLLAGVVHRERDFDDFARQPLLPNRLSMWGSAMAWGDVDDDGDTDLFLGQGAGFAGRLMIRHANGKFEPRITAALELDAGREDMGALFFDADADGDLDLYVASGGVECEADAEELEDRLYWNDGHGNFTRADAGTIPEARDSSSVVTAADFDRDGDLDLFVGGRVIPGEYPLTPRSRLLRNSGGKFEDVTRRIAPTLERSGLVTSAIWSDADDDGWIDLLITHEWGPVKYYQNQKGRLVNRTKEAALSDLLGWFNGIASGDFDRDGDIDYVITNFGLNTKYRASPEKPALLYYGDFEGQGRMRLVEAQYEADTLFPIRGRSCSSHAMPHLGEAFGTYHEFALASLGELYTQRCLDEAHRFAATELRSGVLINDGQATFTFLPFPRAAQIAPAFGAAVIDADGDGNLDVYLAQNFFGPQLETGPMDGGLSLLLLGDGNGNFSPLGPEKSGLIVPGDARCVTTCDLNGDGWSDLLVGQNRGPIRTFLHRREESRRPITIRLRGTAGNRSAVGARITLTGTNGAIQAAEIHSGGGYLSQSPREVVIVVEKNNDIIQNLLIRWPDGQQTNHRPLATGDSIVIQQP